eukprot:5094099-Amphidinium_carterae.1
MERPVPRTFTAAIRSLPLHAWYPASTAAKSVPLAKPLVKPRFFDWLLRQGTVLRSKQRAHQLKCSTTMGWKVAITPETAVSIYKRHVFRRKWYSSMSCFVSSAQMHWRAKFIITAYVS